MKRDRPIVKYLYTSTKRTQIIPVNIKYSYSQHRNICQSTTSADVLLLPTNTTKSSTVLQLLTSSPASDIYLYSNNISCLLVSIPLIGSGCNFATNTCNYFLITAAAWGCFHIRDPGPDPSSPDPNVNTPSRTWARSTWGAFTSGKNFRFGFFSH